MGRPKRTRAPDVVWNVKLLLYSPDDDDLIQLYHTTQTRKGAATIKATLRVGMSPGWEIVEEDDAAMFEALSGLVL